MDVPVIDLFEFRDRTTDGPTPVTAAIDQACRDVGFFSVVGHGVDPAVIDAAHEAALDFFDRPLVDRVTAIKPEPTYPYGYSPFSGEALSRSIGGAAVPDLKETFNVGPVGAPPRPRAEMVDPDERDVWAPTLWPEAVPGLRPALEAYWCAMGALAADLMRAFAVALGQPERTFDALIDQHTSALRLAHYPPLDAPPAVGSFRAGAHTDYGTLTILCLDAEPGLQVENAAGEWFDVEAPDGALVVNLGDLMQRWSNDRWRSTMHRVVVPEGRHGERRLTMPFFHNANWNAVVECITVDGEAPRHKPVEAGAHLMSKFRSTVT